MPPYSFHEFLKGPWEVARGFLESDLQQLHEAVLKLQSDDDTTAEDNGLLRLTVSGDQNNLRLADTTKTVFVSASGSVLHGIAGGTDGRQVLVCYTAASSTTTLKHESTTASIGNRLHCIDSVDIVLSPDEAAVCIYDLESFYWRVFPYSTLSSSAFDHVLVAAH